MDIDAVLTSRLGEVIRQREGVDLLDHAMAAALAAREDERAWALVQLGAGLRATHDYDRALLALDGAALLEPVAARAAAFVCAAAIHHDRGDLAQAQKAGELAHALNPNSHSRKALVSIYWDLWRTTRLDGYHTAWKTISNQLESAGEMESVGPAS